tara:strand:+ start:825 stop:1202 length:378 start_codon:yes stop_codon:yes gene_type:complete
MMDKEIIFKDGFRFKEVSKEYTQKNWQDVEIYGINIQEETESLIDEGAHIEDFDFYGIEIGFKKKQDFIIQVEQMNGEKVTIVDKLQDTETSSQALKRVYTEYQSVFLRDGMMPIKDLSKWTIKS